MTSGDGRRFARGEDRLVSPSHSTSRWGSGSWPLKSRMASPPSRRLLQQQHGGGPGNGDASPSNAPSYQVHRLETESGGPAPVALVKLTDECLSAIRDAQRRRAPLRIRIEPTGGVLEVGSGSEKTSFRFATTALQDQALDIVRHEPRRVSASAAGQYFSTGVVNAKYQIQATDKTFDETRKRAKELVQEQEKAKPKDVGRHRRDEKPKSVMGRFPAVSAATRLPTLGSPLKTDPTARISPNKLGSGSNTGSNANGASTGNGSAPPLVGVQRRTELLKKSLRARVIHVVVTARYKSASEILKRLEKDGLPDDCDRHELESIIDEVSEVMQSSSSGRLALRPNVTNEVDSNWYWFTSEERAHVRKMLGSAPATSSVVAPMRKSGITSRFNTASNTVSPEVVPTPPAAQNARRVSPKEAVIQPPPAPKESPLQTIVEEVPQTTTKRKAHVPAAQVPEKRPRGESLSPPEDPTSAAPTMHPPPLMPMTGVSHQATSTSRDKYASSSSSSSRQTSPSFGSPKSQTVDWEARFPEAKTMAEAEKYYDQFHEDYPEYMRAFKHLNKIAAKFRELERDLTNAPKNSKDYEKVEREIHRKFEQYQHDEEFAKHRQRHADLRHKLAALKMRIQQWERRHQDQELRGRPTINYDSIFAM